ncbi:F-box/kelch-repeat protein-like protein [Salvia divinorum]|uniref:F-box/kelch-repeat protein-like protein n=1 Tax=Salvia divinorum TaxID=28513 RepID=A0ABD1HAC9_SALDI
MDTLHLPEEILEEILLRLPVKSLLRFRCVSKSCRSLIRSNRFIKTHLQKSRSRRRLESWYVIFSSNSENPNLKRCSLRSYVTDPFVNPLPIDDPINDHLTAPIVIVGHSSGLVCILDLPAASFFLWNPATRVSIQLPKLDCDRVAKYGFGWDGQSDAYKVFAVSSKKNKNEDRSERVANIYNSKTNSWKTLVTPGRLDLYSFVGEFVCGKIHWLVKSEYIETFDLKSEVFGRMEFPGVVFYPRFAVDGERRGYLTLVYDDHDNAVRRVWEMEEYGVESSWMEVASCSFRHANESTHLAWRIDQNRELKFSPRDNIVDCDHRHCYIESLVRPVSDNDA